MVLNIFLDRINRFLQTKISGGRVCFGQEGKSYHTVVLVAAF